MSRQPGKNLVWVLLMLAGIRAAVFFGLDTLNGAVSQYAETDGDVLVLEETDNGCRTVLLSGKKQNTYTVVLQSENAKPLTLMYEDTADPYRLYVNNRIVRQNINPSEPGYSTEFAYVVFDVSRADYVDKQAAVTLKRLGTVKPDVLMSVGPEKIIRNIITMRTMYHTVMLMIFLIIFFISVLLYYRDRARYMLITLIIGAVSVVKTLWLGELSAINMLLDITPKSAAMVGSVTSVINYLLYIWLLYEIFHFRIKKRYITAFGVVYTTLTALYFITGEFSTYMPLFYFGAAVIVVFQAAAYMKGKQYSLVILITYSIFAGCCFYQFAVFFGFLKKGFLTTIIIAPQVGSAVYIAGFLTALIKTYFDKIKIYEQKQKEYERLNLLRGIGHDLKLPLSVIKLNNQMIEKYGENDAETVVFAKTALDATAALEEMANNLSSYLNIKTAVGHRHAADVAGSFERLKRFCAAHENPKHCRIIYDYDEKSVSLPVNSFMLDRLLCNLADNALKYNVEVGEVKVGYRVGKVLCFTVEDTGIGIKQAQIDEITKPFYRGDVSRSIQGLGLGLSIVSEIVRSLGGELRIESKSGSGTKITVNLPIG